MRNNISISTISSGNIHIRTHGDIQIKSQEIKKPGTGSETFVQHNVIENIENILGREIDLSQSGSAGKIARSSEAIKQKVHNGQPVDVIDVNGRQIPVFNANNDQELDGIRDFLGPLNDTELDRARTEGIFIHRMDENIFFTVGADVNRSIQTDARDRTPAPAILNIRGHEVNVFGVTDPNQLNNIRTSLEAMPEPLLTEGVSEIFAADLSRLGGFLNQDGSLKPNAGFGGFAGGNGVILTDTSSMNFAQGARSVLFHEAGHNLDSARGITNRVDTPFGTGRRDVNREFVSDYATGNAIEDFAETTRVFVEQRS